MLYKVNGRYAVPLGACAVACEQSKVTGGDFLKKVPATKFNC